MDDYGGCMYAVRFFESFLIILIMEVLFTREQVWSYERPGNMEDDGEVASKTSNDFQYLHSVEIPSSPRPNLFLLLPLHQPPSLHNDQSPGENSIGHRIYQSRKGRIRSTNNKSNILHLRKAHRTSFNHLLLQPSVSHKRKILTRDFIPLRIESRKGNCTTHRDRSLRLLGPIHASEEEGSEREIADGRVLIHGRHFGRAL